MQVYSYIQAEKNLSGVLDFAKKAGEVLVQRPDGDFFIIKPQKKTKRSSLDVSGVNTDITVDEIVGFIRECRER